MAKDSGRTVGKRTAPQIGHTMDDGTVYVGVSPSTKKAMFTTSRDAPRLRNFEEAQAYRRDRNKRKAHGHDDWRLATPGELAVLFNRSERIGRFKISSEHPDNLYWSSKQDGYGSAVVRNFSNGREDNRLKNYHASLRLVCG